MLRLYLVEKEQPQSDNKILCLSLKNYLHSVATNCAVSPCFLKAYGYTDTESFYVNDAVESWSNLGEDLKKTAYNILVTSFLFFHSRIWRDSKRLQTQKAWYYTQRTTKRLKWVSSEESKSKFSYNNINILSTRQLQVHLSGADFL